MAGPNRTINKTARSPTPQYNEPSEKFSSQIWMPVFSRNRLIEDTAVSIDTALYVDIVIKRHETLLIYLIFLVSLGMLPLEVSSSSIDVSHTAYS